MSAAFLVLLGVFVVASLLRLPIALAMLCAGLAYLLAGGKDLALAAEQIMTSLQQSYVLLAVPMFILAANVMNAGTISERLFGAANAVTWLNGIPGGRVSSTLPRRFLGIIPLTA